MNAIIGYCKRLGATEVCTVVLLDKQHDRRIPEVTADFTALHVDDRYVFGFGMDYEGSLRNLDAIYAVGSEQ